MLSSSQIFGIVDYVYALQEMGRKRELKVWDAARPALEEAFTGKVTLKKLTK